MISIPVTQRMIDIATHHASQIPVLNNSILEGAGRLVGCLGELAFQIYYPDAKRVNTYDYDFLLKGKRVEVKTKAVRTNKIYPNYEYALPAYNTRQNTDYYFFTRLVQENNQPKEVILLGYLSKDDFFKSAEFFKKGDPDPTHPSFMYKADSYVVKLSQLDKISER